jgi:fused signal recognition particle receptor
MMIAGVNGAGKTTTIGKLAKHMQRHEQSVLLAAGDTFRAAAVAQLQAWGVRNGVPVVAQGQNADAASVAFDALQAAKARGVGVLIADTAGRLHTQQGLMAELGKIKRVLGKLDPAAPHEVLMVIDGTTGQNALSQLRAFHAAVGVTGLVVTKLDGSAKGGVLFALAREFGIPIRYVGLGEKREDLRIFDPEAFVDALLPAAPAA